MKMLKFLLTASLPVTLATFSAPAQTIAPAYSASYSVNNLGAVPGVPGLLGGAILEAGSPDTLLIGGNANAADGGIYSITVTRGAGNQITGFSGTATLVASAPYIDGGLAYGPGGDLFFTEYPVNSIGEIKPGSVAPDKTVTLGSAGVASSVGGLQFVPAGFPGAGDFKILSYNAGYWYTAGLTPDGSGTYNIGSATTPVFVGGGPEGVAYVPPGSADFSSPSVLVSDYGTGKIEAYQVDANGDPIPGSAQDFLTGLSGAEGAFIDPLTGDFVFSTFGGGNRVVEVEGFVAPPSVPDQASTVSLLLFSLGIVVGARRCATRIA